MVGRNCVPISCIIKYPLNGFSMYHLATLLSQDNHRYFPFLTAWMWSLDKHFISAFVSWQGNALNTPILRKRFPSRTQQTPSGLIENIRIFSFSIFAFRFWIRSFPSSWYHATALHSVSYFSCCGYAFCFNGCDCSFLFPSDRCSSVSSVCFAEVPFFDMFSEKTSSVFLVCTFSLSHFCSFFFSFRMVVIGVL